MSLKGPLVDFLHLPNYAYPLSSPAVAEQPHYGIRWATNSAGPCCAVADFADLQGAIIDMRGMVPWFLAPALPARLLLRVINSRHSGLVAARLRLRLRFKGL